MPTSDQVIHVLQIFLGASATVWELFGEPKIGAAIAIFTTAAGGAGLYLSPGASKSP